VERFWNWHDDLSELWRILTEIILVAPGLLMDYSSIKLIRYIGCGWLFCLILSLLYHTIKTWKS